MSFAQAACVEEMTVACLIAFAPLSKIHWLCPSLSILRLSILFHWSICLFFFWPISRCSNYCGFIGSLKLGRVSHPPLFFSFDTALALLSLLPPYLMLEPIWDIHTITCWGFYWDCIKSIGQVGKNGHLNNIELLIFPFHLCYSLNFMPPPLKCWRPTLQCDGIWRWEIWEAIRFIWGHGVGLP